KTGLVASRELWDTIRAEKGGIARRELASLGKVVRLAGITKLAIVREDPLDRGRRHILNYGHTIGHALELSLGLSHGHAVSIGMVKEAQIGVGMGITPESLLDELRDTLSIHGLPVELPEGFDPRAARALIAHDKKAKSGRLLMPVVKEPGLAELLEVEPDKILLP
ncbi:MAG: 3-dehydroquinate synthase family protein, partial [Candidatus Hydrothermia bacterium]